MYDWKIIFFDCLKNDRLVSISKLSAHFICITSSSKSCHFTLKRNNYIYIYLIDLELVCIFYRIYIKIKRIDLMLPTNKYWNDHKVVILMISVHIDRIFFPWTQWYKREKIWSISQDIYIELCKILISKLKLLLRNAFFCRISLCRVISQYKDICSCKSILSAAIMFAWENDVVSTQKMIMFFNKLITFFHTNTTFFHINWCRHTHIWLPTLMKLYRTITQTMTF